MKYKKYIYIFLFHMSTEAFMQVLFLLEHSANQWACAKAEKIAQVSSQC